MKKLLAYYHGSGVPGSESNAGEYGYFRIHRVAEEGALVGVEAMYEKGLAVQCAADCEVGWYYDGNGGFITAEKFEQVKKDYHAAHAMQPSVPGGIVFSDETIDL